MTQSPLHIALVFHCNQAISPFAQVAAENCYRGLVRVLQRHPDSGFNFHWSGTLLASLRWWYPEFVQEIERGAMEGRWEILASTHGQHVPFSTPDSINIQAIAAHRAALKAAFPGITPRGHWLAERSWRPELADDIVTSGLEYTLIENHMLSDSGCEDLHRPRVIETQSGRPLTIFTDHEEMRHVVNCAIWTGETGPLLQFIERARREAGEGSTPPILCYAEDGEASGLWTVERSSPPQISWEHLDRMLTVLESQPGIRLVKLSDHLDAHRDAIRREKDVIKRGQAGWMCASLSNEHMPYHEDGYTDWFDFNDRAPKHVRVRPMLERMGERLTQTPLDAAAQRRLGLQAGLHVAAHIYEFGCIGIGGNDGKAWDGHRAANLPLRMASGDVPEANGLIDLNGDEVDEIALVNGDLLSLWSPRTGVLLNLFDRPAGDELIGNEIAELRGGRGDTTFDRLSEAKERVERWSGFRSGRQRLEDFEGLWEEVPPSRAWMQWVLNWGALEGMPERVRQVQLEGRDLWALENGTREQATFLWPPRVRPKALVERLTVNGETQWDAADRSRRATKDLPAEIHADGVTFDLLHRGAVRLRKAITQRPEGLEVIYSVENHSEAEQRVTLTVESEWVPSQLSLMLFGRESLEITDEGARNTLTGAALGLTIQSDGDIETQRHHELSHLGLLDTRTLTFHLPAGASESLHFSLSVERGTQFEHIDTITEEWQSWCGR